VNAQSLVATPRHLYVSRTSAEILADELINEFSLRSATLLSGPSSKIRFKSTHDAVKTWISLYTKNPGDYLSLPNYSALREDFRMALRRSAGMRRTAWDFSMSQKNFDRFKAGVESLLYEARKAEMIDDLHPPVNDWELFDDLI
jgi:hypothetical protein